MSRIISIYNQKGGVGKTTTVVNLAAALAFTGFFKKKVLVIDLDPQGNTTSGLGLDKNAVEKDIYSVLNGEATLSEVWQTVRKKTLQLVPSTPDLTGFEIEATTRKDPQHGLSKALKDVQEDFDYILIDCPPSLGMLSMNALVASDAVLIPIQTEFYALEGVSQLVNTLSLVREKLNPSLEVEGILLTMYDARTNLAQDVRSEVNRYFEGKVFETEIPRNVRLAEAPSFGESAVTYDKYSKGAQAYIKLAKELKKKHANTQEEKE